MIEESIKLLNATLKKVVKSNPEVFRNFDITEIETNIKGNEGNFKITMTFKKEEE